METLSDRTTIRHWWVFLLRGLLFILLGGYMAASPISSYIAIGLFFGTVILLTGVAELFHASQERGNRAWYIVLGIIDLILGIILIGNIVISVDILRIMVGVWFAIMGLTMISLPRLAGRNWALIIGGIITIIFALIILFNPVIGTMTIILWTAFAFIVMGISDVWMAFLLK